MCIRDRVIDEAQDMGAEEHALVKALIANYEEMRVIAVGDDDQNIYEFRGSDSCLLYTSYFFVFPVDIIRPFDGKIVSIAI